MKQHASLKNILYLPVIETFIFFYLQLEGCLTLTNEKQVCEWFLFGVQ
jgi:hypothetical protein